MNGYASDCWIWIVSADGIDVVNSLEVSQSQWSLFRSTDAEGRLQTGPPREVCSAAVQFSSVQFRLEVRTWYSTVMSAGRGAAAVILSCTVDSRDNPPS